MSSLPDRQVLSRRRARRHGPATTPATTQPEVAPERFRWSSLITLAIVLAIVIGAGIGMQWAASPSIAKPLANCHTATPIGPHQFAGPPAMCIKKGKTYIAHVQTTQGQFDIAMSSDKAPTTVNNFVVLAVNGYYNGMRFFRTEDWVVQTGDPNNDGTGGPGYTLAPEQAPDASWQTGAVGMARFPDGSISGSQFFMLRGAWPGDGPGDTVFNQFGTILGGTDILSTLTRSDRVIGISISVQ
jgi:cyclophilin family peptidyl-prolyl cis-trans isomerase